MVFSDRVPAMPQIRSGKLRPLAVSTAQRAPQLPSVRTMAESGVPDYTAELWWAFVAPRGTPMGVIARLNASLARALVQPDVKEKMNDLGVVAISSTPERVTEMVKEDTAKWSRVIREIGLQPE